MDRFSGWSNSSSSPLPQGSHKIASRMRTSALSASRRRLAVRFLAAHNFDNFRLIFRLRAFQWPFFKEKKNPVARPWALRTWTSYMRVVTPTELRTKTTRPTWRPSSKALKRFDAALKAQTEAFNSLKEDPLLQPDLDEEEITGTHGTSNLLDLNQFLDSSENDQSSKATSSTSVTRSDSKPTENILGNLTQAFLSTNKKSPDVEGDRK